MIPEDLQYTDQHEWVRETGSDVVRVGITDHAQQQLGDVVFVSLPAVGASFDAGAVAGEVESTKSVSEIFAPVGGEIVAVNEALEANPELVNTGPYGDGWLFEVRTSGAGAGADLLDAAAYAGLVDEPGG